MAFRVGASDASILAKQFGTDIPLPRDLVNLANYDMIIKLMVDGNQSKPFSATTRNHNNMNGNDTGQLLGS